MNRSITIYQKNKNLQESFDPLLISTLGITALIYFIIIVLSYIFSFVLFKISTTTKKELPEFSKEISDIVGKEIKCFSLRDRVPNAFNAGGNYCYMSTALLKMLTKREALAIFLHEYGHYQEKHILKSNTITASTSVLVFTALYLVYLTVFPFSGLFTGLIMILSSVLGTKLTAPYTKSNEFVADSYAVKYGFRSEFLSGLKKMEEWLKKDVCKKIAKKDCEAYFTQLQELSNTHPPLKERYERVLNATTTQKAITYFSSSIAKFGLTNSIILRIKTFLTRLFS